MFNTNSVLKEQKKKKLYNRNSKQYVVKKRTGSKERHTEDVLKDLIKKYETENRKQTV